MTHCHPVRNEMSRIATKKLYDAIPVFSGPKPNWIKAPEGYHFNWIVNNIFKVSIYSNIKWHHVAVLFKTNKKAEQFHRYCMERGLPSKLEVNQDDGSAIHILTVHSAKGFEFPYVFVPFAAAMLENQSLESQTKWDIVEQQDAGNKLFYVACSRAVEHLTILEETLLESDNPLSILNPDHWEIDKSRQDECATQFLKQHLSVIEQDFKENNGFWLTELQNSRLDYHSYKSIVYQQFYLLKYFASYFTEYYHAYQNFFYLWDQKYKTKEKIVIASIGFGSGIDLFALHFYLTVSKRNTVIEYRAFDVVKWCYTPESSSLNLHNKINFSFHEKSIEEGIPEVGHIQECDIQDVDLFVFPKSIMEFDTMSGFSKTLLNGDLPDDLYFINACTGDPEKKINGQETPTGIEKMSNFIGLISNYTMQNFNHEFIQRIQAGCCEIIDGSVNYVLNNALIVSADQETTAYTYIQFKDRRESQMRFERIYNIFPYYDFPRESEFRKNAHSDPIKYRTFKSLLALEKAHPELKSTLSGFSPMRRLNYANYQIFNLNKKTL